MNIKKTIWLAALMALFPSFLHAQGHFDWVKSYSGPDKNGEVMNRIIQTETDGDGNLYVLAQCSGSASIDGVPLVPYPQLNQYYNVVILKMGSTGDIVWKKTISGNQYPSYGYCMRLVGDTTVICMVGVQLESRVYFIDSLYTDARSQLFASDSMFSAWGITYVSLDSNGAFKEQHLVQMARIDNNRNLITMDIETHNPRYEGKIMPPPISYWYFDIDHDGNIVIVRQADDYVDIKTGEVDSAGYNILDRYSVENGLLSGLQVWVDGHGRFDIYPQNQPKMCNVMLMKFSPHFDDLLGYQYLFTDEQGAAFGNDFYNPHDMYIDSSNNVYLISHVNSPSSQHYSARLAETSQILGRGNKDYSFLVKCDSDLRPIYLQHISVQRHASTPDEMLYLSSMSVDEANHQLFVSGFRWTAVDYDDEGNMRGYLNPNPILTDSGDTIQAFNDAFFIRYNLETMASMSSGKVNSPVYSCSCPIDGGFQMCYDKNRVFVPVQYKDSVFAGTDTASVSRSNMQGCGVYIWDTNGHDIGFISIGTESPQRQGIVILSIKDSILYTSGQLTQSSADLGDHHLAYNGRSVAFVSCYTDTAFMTPFQDNRTNQFINWQQVLSFNNTDTTILLTATASSGLPITYTIADTAIANISGSSLYLKSNGTTSITASQQGSFEFLPAPSVTKNLSAGQMGIDNPSQQALLAFPNPTHGDLFVNIPNERIVSIAILSSSGQCMKADLVGNRLSLASYPAGVYFLQIVTDNNKYHQKIIKL